MDVMSLFDFWVTGNDEIDLRPEKGVAMLAFADVARPTEATAAAKETIEEAVVIA